MKLLVLSSRFPLPLEKGDKLRLYHQVRYLSVSHEIILVALTETPFDQNLVKPMQEFCAEIYVIPHKSSQNYLNAIGGLLRGLPVNVGYFVDYASKRKIDAIIDKTRPDAIYVQLLRMAPYVSDRQSIDMYIDYMDAFSLRVSRRAAESGYFASLLWKIEEKLLIRQERKMASVFQHRFIIAESDRAFLEQNGVKTEIQLLGNGVDTAFFHPMPAINKTFDLVFVGNMSYHPNIKAAIFLVEVIGKSLRRLIPGLKILIAGANPSPLVRKLEGDAVEVSGFMPDIREAYAAGKVFVAPIFAGSGMQNKILEAMAMELPCITSPQAIDAIGGIDDLVFAAEDVDSFCQIAYQLLQDDPLRTRLGQESRKFIVENLSWDICCKPLDQLHHT